MQASRRTVFIPIGERSTRDTIHLCWLFVQERGVDLGEVGGHHHLRLHVVRGSIKNHFPEGPQELVLLGYASLYDRPYVTAKHLGSDVGVSVQRTYIAIQKNG